MERHSQWALCHPFFFTTRDEGQTEQDVDDGFGFRSYLHGDQGKLFNWSNVMRRRVATRLAVWKEPSAGSGYSRCLARGAIVMVVTVVIEARLREGLGLGTLREADQNEGDTLGQPPWGLLCGLQHPAVVAEGWPCRHCLRPLR